MFTTIKIRIYPTNKQERALIKAFGCARWLWNNSLAETQKVYKETGRGLGQFELNNRLPELKKEYTWLAETSSQVLQSVNLNLSRAFVNFFKRRTKYPNFKSKRSKQSIQYTQYVRIVGGCKLVLPKIGHVKAVVHREILGTVKTVTISRNPSGQYFASVLTDNGVDLPIVSFDGETLGIDVGLTHLVITSEGVKFDNPRHIARAIKNLKRKQQKLSRKIRGSNTKNKARILVAKAYDRVANARKDWLHKLSHRLVNENQVIAVEDLCIKDLMKNPYLAGAIGDAGWGIFTGFLEYKAARAGRGFVRIGRFFPSSKTCSSCGRVQASVPLSVRAWRCDSCGVWHDRDVNAARNIRLEAQRMIAAGMAGTANQGTVRQGRGYKSFGLARAVEVGSPVLLGQFTPLTVTLPDARLRDRSGGQGTWA